MSLAFSLVISQLVSQLGKKRIGRLLLKGCLSSIEIVLEAPYELFPFPILILINYIVHCGNLGIYMHVPHRSLMNY